MFQITHHLGNRYEVNISRNRYFSKVFWTDRKASSGSILDFVPLNETDFEHSETLFTWVQTWIGVNNIETLTPEGWLEEGRGTRGGKKNGDGIWMPYHTKTTFYGSPPLQCHNWC